MKFYRGEVTLKTDPGAKPEYFTCPICGEDDFLYKEFDHKQDMCYGCIEDGASEEMEHWLQADWRQRCTL